MKKPGWKWTMLDAQRSPAASRLCCILHFSCCLLPAAFGLSLIRLYRWTLSPAKNLLFGPLGHCRFTPSCSAYALEALQTHGPAAGSWLAVKRVCRCHPGGQCGYDPVPEKKCEVRSAKCEVSHAVDRDAGGLKGMFGSGAEEASSHGGR